MTNEEKYYRRCYKILEEISYKFKDNFNKTEVKDFVVKKFKEYNQNIKVEQEKIVSMILNILITYIGLNKEEVEKIHDIKYKKNLDDMKVLDLFYTTNFKKLVEEQEKLRIVKTDFDNWLIIKSNLTAKNNNYEYLKLVRNAFLHGQFSIDYEHELKLINVKNKDFFDANIIYQNFLQFVLIYFGNHDGLGVTTNNMITVSPNKKLITDYNSLKEYLEELIILTVVFKDGDNLFNSTFLSKERDGINTISAKKLLGIEDEIQRLTPGMLNKNQVDFFLNYIHFKFGDNFYNADQEFKTTYIGELCALNLNTKNYICSWLIYIFDIVAKIELVNFKIVQVETPNVCYEGFEIALTILKTYLILYRLQSNEFIEIDYSKIDLDIKQINIQANNSSDIIKLRNKYSNLDNETIEKIRVIEIVRNALSHGNINVLLSTNETKDEFSFLFEFTDRYKDKVKKVQIPINVLKEFLDSKVFLPKYCYSNTLEKVKKI